MLNKFVLFFVIMFFYLGNLASSSENQGEQGNKEKESKIYRSFKSVEDYLQIMKEENKPAILCVGAGHFNPDDAIPEESNHSTAYQIYKMKGKIIPPTDLNELHVDHLKRDCLTLNVYAHLRDNGEKAVDIVNDFRKTEFPQGTKFDVIHLEWIEEATSSPRTYYQAVKYLKYGGKLIVDGFYTSFYATKIQNNLYVGSEDSYNDFYYATLSNQDLINSIFSSRLKFENEGKEKFDISSLDLSSIDNKAAILKLVYFLWAQGFTSITIKKGNHPINGRYEIWLEASLPENQDLLDQQKKRTQNLINLFSSPEADAIINDYKTVYLKKERDLQKQIYENLDFKAGEYDLKATLNGLSDSERFQSSYSQAIEIAFSNLKNDLPKFFSELDAENVTNLGEVYSFVSSILKQWKNSYNPYSSYIKSSYQPRFIKTLNLKLAWVKNNFEAKRSALLQQYIERVINIIEND